MKSQHFLKLFNVAAKFTNPDDTRPVLQAVHIHGYKDFTRFEAADGFHAISFGASVDDTLGGCDLLVWPNRRTSKGHLVQVKPDKRDDSEIQLTAKLSEPYKETIPMLSAGNESFKREHNKDGYTYPDISMVVPGKQAKKFTISLDDLAGIVQSGRDSVTIDKDGTCYPPAVLDFKGIRVGYNPVMLEKGIAFMHLFDVAEVDLYLQAQSSCAICPAGGKLMQYDTPTYIFMPMHLDK